MLQLYLKEEKSHIHVQKQNIMSLKLREVKFKLQVQDKRYV